MNNIFQKIEALAAATRTSAKQEGFQVWYAKQQAAQDQIIAEIRDSLSQDTIEMAARLFVLAADRKRLEG